MNGRRRMGKKPPSNNKASTKKRVGSKKPGLVIRPPSDLYQSFSATDTSYIHGDVHISDTGLTKMSPSDASPDIIQNGIVKNFHEFRFLGILGSGASGYVRKAMHVPTTTLMALKQISIYDPEKRRQILSEVATLYNIGSQRGLVQFYTALYHSGNVYIALEFCDCGSLEDVLRKHNGPIPEKALQHIAIDVLEGLEYLHSQRKVHRDLKPSNICLNSKGEAKLSDFGISAELNDSIARRRTVIGTYTYMSPERITNDGYSFQGDIWGFGLSLMECALGRFPYPTTNIQFEMMQNIAHGPIPTFPETCECSEEFKDFVYACLSKDPESRPSAGQLKEHRWLAKFDPLSFDMEAWIDECGFTGPEEIAIDEIDEDLEVIPSDEIDIAL